MVSSVVSCCSLVLMMSQASVTGTLVKRDSTSKLTRRFVGLMLMLIFSEFGICPCVEKFLNIVVVVGLFHDDSGVPFVGLENVDGCVGAQLLDGCSFFLGGVGFGRCSCGQGLSEKEADVVGCFFSQEARSLCR